MPDEPAKELPATFPNALRLLTGKTPTMEEYHLAPEKLLMGNPLQQVWLDHTDATGQFFAGTSTCSSGTTSASSSPGRTRGMADVWNA